DQKHYWKLVPAGSQRQEQGELQNTPEAVETWAAGWQQRFGGRPIAVCLEQARGALIYMLTKYAHLVLFPVHPTTAARYRETFCTSGAKDDPNDTGFLLDLLLRHRERLRQLQPDTVKPRLLQCVVEERRRSVNERTRQSNRLTNCLKQYFPQILLWFDGVDSLLVGDLLERWPSLDTLRCAHPGTLRQFFQKHNCRSAERNQERIDAIYAAVPATNDAAVLEAGTLTARGLVALLRTLRDHIAELDRRIEQLVMAHPGWCAVRLAARRRCGTGAAFNRGLGNASRALRQRLRSAMLQWHCAREGVQRQDQLGPLPADLSNVSAADLSRVCSSFDRTIGVGQSLLPAPPRGREQDT